MLRNLSRALACLLPILVVADTGYGGRPDLVEVQVGENTFQGKVVAHNKSLFWLLQRDGRMRRLRMDSVSRFRSVSPRFRGYRAVDIKSALRKEFGHDFAVVSTQHYVVVASPHDAKKFAEQFETVYRAFVTYFRARRFPIEKPKFPLVAIVFPDRAQFVKYARKDSVTIASRILGYYHPGSNRVALFDDPRLTLGKVEQRTIPVHSIPGLFARAGGSASLADTIVHEGTHQVAYNTGLHTRIGPTPRWVVEGLATVFEAPGVRNRRGGRGAKSRINPGRFDGFRRYVAAGRKRGSLRQFIAADTGITRNIHNFYAEAWALSYFLLETRSRNYSKFLRIVSGRDPRKPYPARDRTADFQQAFGTNIDRLERDFLRFMNRL